MSILRTKIPNAVTVAELIDQLWSKQNKYTRQEINKFTKLFISVLKENLLNNRQIQIPGFGRLNLKVLPPVGNSKSPHVEFSSAIANSFRYKPQFVPSRVLIRRINSSITPTQEEIDYVIKRGYNRKKKAIKYAKKNSEKTMVYSNTSNN